MIFNLSTDWTEQDLSDLLASVTDDKLHQLVITKAGDVKILEASQSAKHRDDLHGQFETWVAGNGYCGKAAAADKRWVRELAFSLRENWPTLKGDRYIDQ